MADCELHVDPSFEKAIDMGMEVFEYGTQNGPLDQCTVDSLLELGQHVNGLLRGNGGGSPVASIEAPRSADHALALIGMNCYVAKKNAKPGQAMAVDLPFLANLWEIIRWLIGLISGFGLEEPESA